MMKKTILLLAVAIIGISSSVKAQEYWNFGVKGGVNFTNMTSDGFENNKARTGYHIGLLAEIPVSDRFSLQPEVLYSTQGLKDEGSNFTDEYKLDYVQVPVIAKIYLVDGLALEVGPSFNFLVNEEYEIESDALIFRSNPEVASDFEFGGALGASYKFNNGFFLNGRYTQGFSNVYDSDDFDDDAIKNNGFQLGLGFQF